MIAEDADEESWENIFALNAELLKKGYGRVMGTRKRIDFRVLNV
jgi:hypothetical protein